MKGLIKYILIIWVFVFGLSILFPRQSLADVWVNGYYRSNGTYVNGYYRSDPDGDPYNNWSFPGNTNPYTGVTAGGNPDTYLNNYYSRSYNSYSSPWEDYYYSPSYSDYSALLYNSYSPSYDYSSYYGDSDSGYSSYDNYYNNYGSDYSSGYDWGY